MRDHTYKYFAIISAELAKHSDTDNAMRSQYLEDDLTAAGLYFETVTGCYKGVKERSFIVFNPVVEDIMTLARKFNQDSFLIRTNRNDCFLHFTEMSDVRYIGEFKYMPKEVATDQRRHDSYTILHDKGIDLYFVAVLKWVVPS